MVVVVVKIVKVRFLKVRLMMIVRKAIKMNQAKKVININNHNRNILLNHNIQTLNRINHSKIINKIIKQIK